MWTIGIFASLFTLISLSFNTWNTSLFDSAIKDAKREIEVLAGILKPESAFVHGLQGLDDSNILMEAVIIPSSIEGIKYFTVTLSGTVIVGVEGGPGRILGYSGATQGPIAQFETRTFHGELSETQKQKSELGSFDTEGLENGRIVTETAPIHVNIYRRSKFFSCGEAAKAIDELISLGNDVGKVGIVPFFSGIDEPLEEHIFFNVTIVRGDNPTCEKMSAMAKWNFQ